jgi:phage FluMu protein Com
MSKSRKRNEWRCRRCGGLLGIVRAGGLHLKCKHALFSAEDNVKVVCRHCDESNELTTTGKRDVTCYRPSPRWSRRGHRSHLILRQAGRSPSRLFAPLFGRGRSHGSRRQRRSR